MKRRRSGPAEDNNPRSNKKRKLDEEVIVVSDSDSEDDEEEPQRALRTFESSGRNSNNLNRNIEPPREEEEPETPIIPSPPPRNVFNNNASTNGPPANLRARSPPPPSSERNRSQNVITRAKKGVKTIFRTPADLSDEDLMAMARRNPNTQRNRSNIPFSQFVVYVSDDVRRGTGGTKLMRTIEKEALVPENSFQADKQSDDGVTVKGSIEFGQRVKENDGDERIITNYTQKQLDDIIVRLRAEDFCTMARKGKERARIYDYFEALELFGPRGLIVVILDHIKSYIQSIENATFQRRISTENKKKKKEKKPCISMDRFQRFKMELEDKHPRIKFIPTTSVEDTNDKIICCIKRVIQRAKKPKMTGNYHTQARYKYRNPQTIWFHQLREVPGVTEEHANIIMRSYPLPRNLIEIYRSHRSVKEKEELLFNINPKGVPARVSKKIYTLFTSLDGDKRLED